MTYLGKRSNFERVARDYYPTPLAAVLPLLPHLAQRTTDTFPTFVEPCAGDGRLINHLIQNSDMRCVWALDIEPRPSVSHPIEQKDALEETYPHCDFIITNPPWDRKILHPMIEHFTSFCPTWLLFDADWAHTKQSAPYMTSCVKIVSIGRVKWIEDSKMTGKDNCAWYLFDANHNSSTEFDGRTK